MIGLLTFLATPIGIVALGSVFPHNFYVPFVTFLVVGVVLAFVHRVRSVGVGLVLGTLMTLAGLFVLGALLAGSVD